MPHGLPEILTVEDLATLLRVSERTVYKWAQDNEIPGGKVGASWRFEREAVEQWIKQRLSSSHQQHHVDQSVAHRLHEVWQRTDTFFVNGGNKTLVLDALIAHLARKPGIQDAQAFRDAIYHRESLMSTGIGGNVAVPHCRLESIECIAVAAAISTSPIEGYESIDGKPVHIVFMIAAGAGQHQQHIRLLADIASLVRDEELRANVLNCSIPDQVYELLTGTN